MENRKMTLIMIEDDEDECECFRNYTENLENVEMIATTNSSSEGIELFKTYTPEAIILDNELHRGEGSGLEFVEGIKDYTSEFKPIIVVITNASSNILYDRLHDEGVDFIFYKKQKDYSPKLIISTLLSLRKSLYKFNNVDKNIAKESKIDHENRIKNKINAELDLIGISSHLKGRKYIYEAINYLIKENNEQGESVFNYLANMYKRSSSSISRVMQTAINYAWRTSAPEDLEAHYTAKVNYNTGVPTPTEFIYFYSQKISKVL